MLADARLGYVSRYALGRDYHKVLRAALARLAEAMAARMPHRYRVFVDSGPVLEKALARNAGLGWIGKHTNLIVKDAGSGSSSERYSPTCHCQWTNPPLRTAAPARPACPPAPTNAIVARTSSMHAAASPT